MARLVVMYKTPKDAGGFDAYYFNTHVPIAKRIPGLRKYEVSKGPVGRPPAHRACTWLRRCISMTSRPFRTPS
jgi:uncharacterized protein (TIGR02118 family)